MSKRNINNLHTTLKELYRNPKTPKINQVSFLTELGETLTIQIDNNVITRYAQNTIPEITYPEHVFWRYSDDVFVDVTLAMPDYVFLDVASEVKRLRSLQELAIEVLNTPIALGTLGVMEDDDE